MDSSSKSKEEGAVRHCAYCLQVCGYPSKLCGRCNKRAYCSKDCQVKDWSSSGDGQRHVKWCNRHEHGEEDVDWEVVPIPNKGLGIRAKKLMPVGYMIIVEPFFTSPDGHPGIKDLLATEAELLMLKSELEEHFAVCLRIGRVNHACKPNASVAVDETAHVGILFALRDIQPGEEITFSYYFPVFFCLLSNLPMPLTKPDCSIEEVLNDIKKALLAAGIVCPAGCLCCHPTVLTLLQKGRLLRSEIKELDRQLKTGEALAAGEKLLDIHRRLNLSLEPLNGDTYFLLFKIAVQRSEFLPRAMEYLRSAAELSRKICPYSEMHTKKFERLMEHPETHPNYLKIDKMQQAPDLAESLRAKLNM